MNYINLLFCITLFIVSSVSTTDNKPPNVNLTKRNLEELSYSYAATDIGSKSGTRIKTITVIKNIANKKHKTLKINPELHKNENWGSEFRDNFDKIAKIPEIPDVFGKDNDDKSAPEPESQEQPKFDAPPKDSIPIYEEPEADIEPKVEDAPQEVAKDSSEEPAKKSSENSAEEAKEESVEMVTEEPPKPSQVISKLPKDIELIELGPISLKQAEQSAKSQALRFKTYRSEEKELKEYIQHSPTIAFTRPIKPLLSKPYTYGHLELNTSEENPRHETKQSYIAAESNAQSNYANYPPIKFTNIQQLPTTTVASPYIAPNKKSQLLKRLGAAQNQNTPVTSDPYIAPSVRKAYTTITPPILPLGSVPLTATKNPNQLRFRGVRY